MIKKITALIQRYVVVPGACPNKLAAAVSWGVYLAFTPFLGLHMALALFISWFFSLNVAVMLAVSCIIHNPWTVFPIYATDYMCGNYVLSSWCGIDPASCNPCWMGYCNAFLTAHTGLPSLSLWSFLIGGNILGIGLSSIAYFATKRFFSRHIQASAKSTDENNSAK